MQSIFKANRTALITGASSGIGLELAKVLAPKVDSLVVVARRRDRLQQLAKDLQFRFPDLNVAIEAGDLSAPEGLEGLLWQLEAHRLNVDVLVNQRRVG